MYNLNTHLQSIINLLYPKFCIGCSHYSSYICSDCQKRKLKVRYFQQCHVCKNETFLHLVHSDCAAETFLDGVVICYQYSDLVEELVKQVKYQFASAIITDIVRLMETYWSAYQIEIDTLCGVPLSTRKLRWRGFNQSELMARQLAFALGKPFNELLTRNVNTKTQVGQSRVSRLENLHNVFAPKVTPISGNVLIVDDVMTTGSTLEQCAKVLKESGAAKVYGFAFARG